MLGKKTQSHSYLSLNAGDSFFIAMSPQFLCTTWNTSPHPPIPSLSFHSRRLGSRIRFLANLRGSDIADIWKKITRQSVHETIFVVHGIFCFSKQCSICILCTGLSDFQRSSLCSLGQNCSRKSLYVNSIMHDFMSSP